MDKRRSGALRALLQDTVTVTSDAGGEPGGINDTRVHGYLVAIAFGLLLPLNIVLAQSFRDFEPTWFHLHRVVGTVAWVSGVVGAGFGQHLLAANPVPTSHKVIGWLIVALATLQITAFLLCPSKGHRLRPLFAVYHRWTGRSAAGLAIANVFIGLHVSAEALKFYWGYGIILGAILLLAIGKEVIDAVRLGSKPVTTVDKMQPGANGVQQAPLDGVLVNGERHGAPYDQ